jgi:catechol 2,3-dioxygenase-like lactoylglutathione lyase family enzyme
MYEPAPRSNTPQHALIAVAAAAVLAILPTAAYSQADPNVVQPLLWHSALPRSPENVVNIFRRFDATKTEAMIDFYSKALGIEPLPFAANARMIRFQVGTSELKLFPSEMGNALRSRPIQQVVGVRLMTLTFPDQAALTARFEQNGHAAPKFQADGERAVAHVQDPDGQWVELVVVRGAPKSAYEQVEYGLTVTDIERSRAFYRDFVGLQELQAVEHPLLGTTKYSYRHGDQIISLFSFGADLPKDTDTAGIQYVTWDVAGIDAVAKARNATIDRPLSDSGRFPRTVWLLDPDGITNYFAQFHATPDALRTTN